MPIHFVNDEAIVLVGEPDCPKSTNVRAHNRSLIIHADKGLSALDHDFHICGFVPALTLKADISVSYLDVFSYY